MKTRFPRTGTLVKNLLTSSKRKKQIRHTFTKIYKTNHWRGVESVSGQGSSLDQTIVIRKILPVLLQSVQATTLLDAPCGDHFWMNQLALDLESYTGVDIVREIIVNNRYRYSGPGKNFLVRDVTKDSLPRADCILCRDCLDHLSFNDAMNALKNFRRSGSRYLLATTYVDRLHNDDIVTGNWRPTNLEQAPFYFPPPLQLVNEGCTEDAGLWSDKSLGLWRIDDLPFANP